MVVVRAGAGPRLVLIHGSAADHATWAAQLASPILRERVELVAYDRRADAATVEEHAADAAALAPDYVIGSSFGAVIALELARTRELRGAVLIEPPMRATDAPDPAQAAFLGDFDRELAARGGDAAGELFLRTAIGDAAFERMPPALRERAVGRWREIRADSAALVAYAPRYDELARVATPVLLVGGDRSSSYFRPTLTALAAALPHARLEIIAGGHMLHAESARRFNEVVADFTDHC